MITHKIGLFFSLIAIAICTQSCHKTTNVKFDPHAPYQSQYRINEPLVIVLPDYYERVYNRHELSSGFLNKDIYRIYYGMAMAEESEARFARKFSSIHVLSNKQYSLITGEDSRTFAFELEEDDYPTPEEITEMKRELEFAPNFVKESEGYLIYLTNIDFEYSQDTAYYRFYIEFIDRATDETLFEGNLKGRGGSNYSVTSAYNNRVLIQNAVTKAFNNAFLSLDKEINEALALK